MSASCDPPVSIQIGSAPEIRDFRADAAVRQGDVRALAVQSQPVTLEYDLVVARGDGSKSAGRFDSAGGAFSAEMLPLQLNFSGVGFNLAPAEKPDAVVARGQTISLPAAKFNKVYVLAASTDGDQKATFLVGDKPIKLTVQNRGGYVGQWERRIWRSREVPGRPTSGSANSTRTDPYGEMVGLNPGFIKPAPVAWFASHRHTADGANASYAYSYLFVYAIDAAPSTKTLTLPNNDKIRIVDIPIAERGAHRCIRLKCQRTSWRIEGSTA
jgi:alpha-mannosidase